MLKLYVVFFHIHIFFWNYNSEPAQKIRLNIAPIEIAQCRTYVQWLWQPRTTQPPEQPQPGGHFSVKLLLCKVARQRHPCVSASHCSLSSLSARATVGRRLRNWEAETGEAEWGQSTKLLVLKMAWGFYGSGKRFRSRLDSLSSVSMY